MYQDDLANNTYEPENHDESEKIKIGLVTDCNKLNVRERPTVESPVV